MVVVTVVALAVSSCESHGSKTAESAPASSASTSPAPSGTQVSTVVDKVRIRATAAPVDGDHKLTIGGGDAGAPEAEALVVATPPIRVQLDGGKVQPSAPVQLEFDLSDRPDIVAELTDTVVPVVESVSTTDSTERDMFTGTWDPATQTLTAQVTHLTDFWVSAFNVVKAIESGIGRTFEVLRGDSTSPCREKSELTLSGTEYVLTTVSPGAIAGCLVDNNGSVAIDFDNATGGFYIIVVAPDDVGGDWIVTEPLSMGDAAGSMVVGLVPNNKGVLAGRSSGRFTLNPGIVEADIRMMPQPHGILVKSLLSGVSMFGIDLKRFEGIPEAWDCFVTGVNVANIDGSVTTAELNGMIGGIAQCLITAEGAMGGNKSKLAALHRLSVATALLTELPQQLGDFVASGLQEAARNSVKDFRLRSAATSSTTTTTAPSPADAVIDRVEVTTWAYDRVEGDTYVADNTGAKQIEVFWKSFAGADQVRSGCTSTVRIEGPGTSEAKDESGCDSYNPGTYVKARSPGVHTVTVTVRQDGQPDITAQRTVTVLPHS
ncbi:hypothetical protein [Mycolicibacterium austroafricanum]|uniref:Uncharacterized protein n=2 Tax=Mycolicibacterium TaxID=1866885 RepID=A0ABT8HKK9_MYCAO|nr:hypothetical protein [Mycolicibacterium austroafricanum]MDN4521287.1 hypothetical protein [Mycolicibacterium austroafricanum]QRZ08174.1 hypothetical protein JN090_06465 [Mycolicibacterium austroafricanum]